MVWSPYSFARRCIRLIRNAATAIPAGRATGMRRTPAAEGYRSATASSAPKTPVSPKPISPVRPVSKAATRSRPRRSGSSARGGSAR